MFYWRCFESSYTVSKKRQNVLHFLHYFVIVRVFLRSVPSITNRYECVNCLLCAEADRIYSQGGNWRWECWHNFVTCRQVWIFADIVSRLVTGWCVSGQIISCCTVCFTSSEMLPAVFILRSLSLDYNDKELLMYSCPAQIRCDWAYRNQDFAH